MANLSGRLDRRRSFSTTGQFTALHQLGPKNIPADAEQPRRLNLVAMTEFIGCSRDRHIDIRI
jgi:hypothetical protein